MAGCIINQEDHMPVFSFHALVEAVDEVCEDVRHHPGLGIVMIGDIAVRIVALGEAAGSLSLADQKRLHFVCACSITAQSKGDSLFGTLCAGNFRRSKSVVGWETVEQCCLI